MNTLNAIAPEDIEAMDVLRDGSAAAIYGTRGNNGVVIVTTKQARARERTELDYSGYVSYDMIAKKPNILTAEEYVQYAEDTSNQLLRITVEEMMCMILANKNNFSQNHSLSASGGSTKSNYRNSIGYHNEGLASPARNRLQGCR